MQAREASLQSRVAAQIREGIVTGDYAAGTGLSEVTLSGELGVSRTPVREALKQLATEGLVEIVPRVGTFVATPTRRDINELYGLKEIFEGFAAGLLAPRGDEPAIASLAGCTGDGPRFAERLVEAADSVKLALTYRWHMNLLASHEPPDRGAQAVAELEVVLERLRAKDAHGAEHAMRDHVRADLRALMQR
jgi:DNA-binding GntR family transcriptional regulator